MEIRFNDTPSISSPAIQLVVFDCDGVIIDSVEIKNRAFGELVKAHGSAAAERMAAYHLANGGVSRYRKFEWFYTEVLGREITHDQLEELGKRFQKLVLDAVVDAPLMPGIQETLDQLHRRVPMSVASGTPHEELVAILDTRGLSRFFTHMCGSPPGKTELLARIIDMHDVAASCVVMVGDSLTDLEAAGACGCSFFGIGDAFTDISWPTGKNCRDFNHWIQDLL